MIFFDLLNFQYNKFSTINLEFKQVRLVILAHPNSRKKKEHSQTLNIQIDVHIQIFRYLD